MLPVEGAVPATPTKRVGLGVSLTAEELGEYPAPNCGDLETYPKEDVPFVCEEEVSQICKIKSGPASSGSTTTHPT